MGNKKSSSEKKYNNFDQIDKDNNEHPKNQNGCCSCSICFSKRCFYCLKDDKRPRWRMRCEDTHERNEPCPLECFGYKKECHTMKT